MYGKNRTTRENELGAGCLPTEERQWRCRGGKVRVQATQEWIIRYTIHVSGSICQATLCLATAAGASNEPNPVFLTMPLESDLLPPKLED